MVQKNSGVEGVFATTSIPESTYQFNRKKSMEMMSSGMTLSFLFIIRLKVSKVVFGNESMLSLTKFYTSSILAAINKILAINSPEIKTCFAKEFYIVL